jgi:hypothetical protein
MWDNLFNLTISEDIVRVVLLQNFVFDKVSLNTGVNGVEFVINILDVTNDVLNFSSDWVNNLFKGVSFLHLNWRLDLNFQDFWLVDDGVLEDFVQNVCVLDVMVGDWVTSVDWVGIICVLFSKDGVEWGGDLVISKDVLCVQTEIKFPIVNTGGVVSVVYNWVNVLVEKIRVTEEGCENFLSPVLLEVRGGQIQLEERVAEVLTEEGKGVISLEQWVADDFVKAQSIDSVDGIDVADEVIVSDVFSDAVYILPHTDSMIPLQETSLVVKGLSSNASCEQCDCDESLHDTR